MAAKQNKILQFGVTRLSENDAESFARLFERLQKTAPESEKARLNDGQPVFYFQAMQLYIRAVELTIGAAQEMAEQFSRPLPGAHPEALQEVNSELDGILGSRSHREIKERLQNLHCEAAAYGEKGREYELQIYVSLLCNMEQKIMRSMGENATHASQQMGWNMVQRLPYVMDAVSEHWVKPASEEATQDLQMFDEAAPRGDNLKGLAERNKTGSQRNAQVEFYRTLLEFPETVRDRIKELSTRGLG